MPPPRRWTSTVARLPPRCLRFPAPTMWRRCPRDRPSVPAQHPENAHRSRHGRRYWPDRRTSPAEPPQLPFPRSRARPAWRPYPRGRYQQSRAARRRLAPRASESRSPRSHRRPPRPRRPFFGDNDFHMAEPFLDLRRTPAARMRETAASRSSGPPRRVSRSTGRHRADDCSRHWRWRFPESCAPDARSAAC